MLALLTGAAVLPGADDTAACGLITPGRPSERMTWNWLGLADAGQDAQKGDSPGAAHSKWGRNHNCSPGECLSKMPGCEQLNGWKTALSNVVIEILLLS